MSVQYKAIYWNPVKRTYDAVLAAGLLAYLAVFLGISSYLYPSATPETLLIRALGTAAFLLLHLILAIGPLCRLCPFFLPLLYNRRHLGVTMFCLALAHALFSLIQFHALGNVHPLVSLFTSNTRFDSLREFPFELLGFAALLILFLMAATSHDFWLKNLSPRIWKTLHMSVYSAYALLVGHVALGALQSEPHPVLAASLILGFLILASLHLAAGRHESRRDRPHPAIDGLIPVGPPESIPDSRACVVASASERIAVFRNGRHISALSNVCEHQNGPLGEGRIIDGCVTCPWHGYQYLPDSGASPPPFTEKVATFRTSIHDGIVYVDPRPCPPGTRLEPTPIP